MVDVKALKSTYWTGFTVFFATGNLGKLGEPAAHGAKIRNRPVRWETLLNDAGDIFSKCKRNAGIKKGNGSPSQSQCESHRQVNSLRADRISCLITNQVSRQRRHYLLPPKWCSRGEIIRRERGGGFRVGQAFRQYLHLRLRD